MWYSNCDFFKTTQKYLTPFLNFVAIVPRCNCTQSPLQFAAQASHELLPPNYLEPVLKIVVNNFVNKGNSTEVIAVRLNTIRDILRD
jgi:hypothetical protein